MPGPSNSWMQTKTSRPPKSSMQVSNFCCHPCCQRARNQQGHAAIITRTLLYGRAKNRDIRQALALLQDFTSKVESPTKYIYLALLPYSIVCFGVIYKFRFYLYIYYINQGLEFTWEFNETLSNRIGIY